MTIEVPSLYEKIFDRSCKLTEIQLQKLCPANPGYYSNHHKVFLEKFLAKESNQIINLNGLVYVGPKKYVSQIHDVVTPEIELAEQISKKKVEKFIIFVGDGSTQENDYRAIGRDNPTVEAISGALSCYINSDFFDDSGFIKPSVIRTAIHESRHVIYGLLQQENGFPTFPFDSNDIIREALGGPLNINLWKDLQDEGFNIDITDLESEEISFWDWYSRETNKTNYEQSFFTNPVSKVFFEWASQKGDERYWLNQPTQI